MRDAKVASKLLMAAISAAGRDDWPAVVNYLNGHPGLTPCTVLLVLARIVAEATGPDLEDGQVAVAFVAVDEDITPDNADDLDTIAALISATCNGDEDGAHEITHHLTPAQAHRVISRMLVTAYAVIGTSEDPHARNN